MRSAFVHRLHRPFVGLVLASPRLHHQFLEREGPTSQNCGVAKKTSRDTNSEYNADHLVSGRLVFSLLPFSSFTNRRYPQNKMCCAVFPELSLDRRWLNFLVPVLNVNTPYQNFYSNDDVCMDIPNNKHVAEELTVMLTSGV